jgi:transketolase
VAIDNDSSTWGWRDGLEARFAVAGWQVGRVDGRDHAAIAAGLRRTESNAPTLIVADVKETS